MKPQDRAELRELAAASGITSGEKPAPPSAAEFERLQGKVDTLENVLCALALHEDLYCCSFRKILKRELKAVRIMEQ